MPKFTFIVYVIWSNFIRSSSNFLTMFMTIRKNIHFNLLRSFTVIELKLGEKKENYVWNQLMLLYFAYLKGHNSNLVRLIRPVIKNISDTTSPHILMEFDEDWMKTVGENDNKVSIFHLFTSWRAITQNYGKQFGR